MLRSGEPELLYIRKMKFIIGMLFGLLILAPVGAYLFVREGFFSLATSARPLPGEEYMAHLALRASIGLGKDQKDPLPVTDDNLLAGAKAYRENCAVCHGLPGQPKTALATGMFPPPPQLLEGKDMVTDDPEGTTFWKISNGIRLSGMPRFDGMPQSVRWQMAQLLRQADKLPAAVQANLRAPLTMPQ